MQHLMTPHNHKYYLDHDSELLERKLGGRVQELFEDEKSFIKLPLNLSLRDLPYM